MGVFQELVARDAGVEVVGRRRARVNVRSMVAGKEKCECEKKKEKRKGITCL